MCSLGGSRQHAQPWRVDSDYLQRSRIRASRRDHECAYASLSRRVDLLTHAHFDHVLAVRAVAAALAAPVLAHAGDAPVRPHELATLARDGHFDAGTATADLLATGSPPRPAPGRPLWDGRVDRYVDDGELLSVGPACVRAWHTPNLILDVARGVARPIVLDVDFHRVVDYFARTGRWSHLCTALRNLAELLRGSATPTRHSSTRRPTTPTTPPARRRATRRHPTAGRCSTSRSGRSSGTALTQDVGSGLSGAAAPAEHGDEHVVRAGCAWGEELDHFVVE